MSVSGSVSENLVSEKNLVFGFGKFGLETNEAERQERQKQKQRGTKSLTFSWSWNLIDLTLADDDTYLKVGSEKLPILCTCPKIVKYIQKSQSQKFWSQKKVLVWVLEN